MKLINKLKELKATETKQLKLDVIDYILDSDYKTDEEIANFFSDLARSGCQSGMINHLIYYKDTSTYYDDNEDEIEDLITENMENIGIETRPLFIESLNGSAENITQEKNLLSWFAFEETARAISQELGLEV